MLVLKLRSERVGDRVRDTLFVGQEGFTLQNAGEVTLSVGEWQMFGALVLMGAEQVRAHRARQGLPPDVEVVFEGWDPSKE